MYRGLLSAVLLAAGAMATVSGPEVEQLPDINKVEIAVTARNNGSFEQDVFFAGKDAGYELSISSEAPEYELPETLVIRIGDKEMETPVTDGNASFSIEPGYEGKLEISYDDETVELPDYIVAEEIPPVVNCAVLEGESGKELHLTIEDQGEIISGICSYEYLLNGKEVEGSREERKETELANGQSVCSRVDIAVPIEEEGTYELEVTAEDQCGNQIEKTILRGNEQKQEEQEEEEPKKAEDQEEEVQSEEELLKSVEQEGIEIMLPTDISLMVFTGPDPAEGNIQSQDIMIINKNPFPVRVRVNRVQYEIEQDGEEEKQCELGVRVREYNKEERVIGLSDSDSESSFSLELEAGSEELDAQALLRTAAEWVPTGDVQSPDYGVLRLEGSTLQGNWKSGDLKVQVLFELERIE